MPKTKIILILVGIFVLGYVLRVVFLKNLSLTFGYDQARDAYNAQQIISGDLKILGPPSSTPGLYHGVFYYYLLAPAFLLGNGSPITAAYWIALLNAATVFIVFTLTFLMTKKVSAGMFAALLFAISFEATQYATWLSNPTIGVWTVPLIYLGLWAWIREKKRWGMVVCALGLGLSIQAEIFLAYHLVPILLWLWISRQKITRNNLFTFGLVLFAALSTLLISEVKFGFKSLSGINQLALSSDSNLAYAKSIGDYALLYLNQAGRIFSFNSYPGNIGYGGAFIFILIGLAIFRFTQTKKLGPEIFLATWLLSHITVVTLGGTSTPFLMVGIGPAVSVLMALFLYKLWTDQSRVIAIIIIVILISGNLSMVMRENPKGSTLFAIQKDMLLSKQLEVVDYTYQKAGGQPFSINSLTSPLWINIVWTYLYKWYGEPKYGYLPSWYGKDQVGQLDSLPKVSQRSKAHFLILEPMGGIPAQYLEETLNEEDSGTEILDEKYFGELRVQERTAI